MVVTHRKHVDKLLYLWFDISGNKRSNTFINCLSLSPYALWFSILELVNASSFVTCIFPPLYSEHLVAIV